MTSDQDRQDPDSVAVLAAELHELKRRAFGTVSESELARRVPNLSALARRRFRVDASAPAPLRKLFQAAVAQIGNEELRAPAAALFGVDPAAYGKTLPYRQDLAAAGFDPPPSRSTFRQRPQYTERIVEELAAALVLLSGAAIAREVQDRRTEARIVRPDLLADAERLLAGGRLLWVWGEPGTGKSVLAQQLADRVRGHLPVVRIRLGNSRVAEADILAAMEHDAVDARSWSSAACAHHLRRMLAEGRTIGAAIIDGADEPGTVWDLVPGDPRVPVIVTGRTRPAEPGPALLRIGAYTSAESAAAIGELLPDLPAEERDRLAEAVAHHPLVIDRICRHVPAVPGQTVRGLVDALTADLPSTIDAVDSISGATERLLRIYQRTLEVLRSRDPDAVRVLETLVWISTKGTVPEQLASDFLRHRFPGPVGALKVSAAEVVLSQWALVALEGDAFVMHPLTMEILQSLLGPSCQEVLTGLFEFLYAAPVTSGTRLVRVMRGELAVADGALRQCWGAEQSWVLVSESMWLRYRREPPEAERYELIPTGIQATMGAVRRPVEDPESADFVAVVDDYFWAMLGLYAGPRPDTEISEPDGMAHYVKKGTAPVDGVVQAKCGKRWRGSTTDPAGLPICPWCVDRWAAAVAHAIENPPMAVGHLTRQVRRSLEANDFEATTIALERMGEPFIHWAAPGGHIAMETLESTAFELFHLAEQVEAPFRLRCLGVAENWYRTIVEIAPEHTEALRRLGRVLSAQAACLFPDDEDGAARGYAEAARCHRQALDLRPDHAMTLSNLKEALMWQAACVDLETGERLYREVEFRLRTSSGAHQRDPDVLTSIATALDLRGMCLAQTDPLGSAVLHAEAARWAEMSLRERPDHPRTLSLLAGCHYNGGRVAQHNGRAEVSPEVAVEFYEQAVTHFSKALAIEQRPDFARGLGRALLFMGELLKRIDTERSAQAFKEAIDPLRQALRGEEEEFETRRELAHGLTMRARRLSGDDPEASDALFAEATAHLRRALELDATEIRVLRALAFAACWHAELVGSAPLRAEATRLLERVLEAAPDDQAALDALARISGAAGSDV